MKRFTLFLAACALAAVLALELASGGAPLAFALEKAPFALSLAIAAGLSLACLVFGAATGDYSWVDRLWSIVPVVYAWIYAARGGFCLASVIAALLVTLWGARLTANFARRGGYSGMEDYRWSALRGGITNPLLWQLFNALFICAFQLGLMALFTSPLGRLGEGRVGPLFVLAAVLALLFLAYETRADAQQWEFHNRKAALLEGGPGVAKRDSDHATRDIDPATRDIEAEQGFRSSGLFRLSRHPAYFGELGFWWSVYLLCAAGSGSLFHASVAGALVLTLLFVGSVRFTESLSAAKYPGYEDYRARTSAVIPWFPRRGATG